MKITPSIFLTLILCLGGCAESSNSQVKELETADVASEKLIEDQSKNLDYSKISSEELQEDIKNVQIKIDKLSAKGLDSLGDEELYRVFDLKEQRGELLRQLVALEKTETAAEKAETAAEKAETAAAEKRLQRAKNLAGTK